MQGALFSEMWKELKFAMRCMTPSTRAKSSTPVIHEPSPAAPKTAETGARSEMPEMHSEEQEAIEPVSTQSQNTLTVPMAESNEALLCSSGNESPSSGSGSLVASFPPLPQQNSTASPWSHLNSMQRTSPSVGEDWWRISQSAV